MTGVHVGDALSLLPSLQAIGTAAPRPQLSFALTQ